MGADDVDQLLGRAPRLDPGIPWHSDSREPVVMAGLLGLSQPWSVWPEVVAAADPGTVLGQVEAAGLKGRGGAGFPVALKWRSALDHKGPRVVVANGDEGDPGSFVDRLLMEEDPHRVLEGLALACFAVGAGKGVVFVRSEYPRAVARMREAVREAEVAGHLGEGVHGSGFTLEVGVAEGAGSYVSGEETALLNGLEGLRGAVRARPPYPTEAGLAGRPTVVNNVETLAALPWIIRHGGAAYARMGVAGESGTIVVCLSERFARPGAYEVETGTMVRRVVEDLGGGLRTGSELRSLQLGGPLGGFLSPEDLDVALTDSALAGHGAALGHAGIVAFDQSVSGGQVLGNLWEFADSESCGQCSPCRVGSRRGRVLAALPGTQETRASRTQVLDTMAVGSLCAFGRRVPAAVRSLARVYRLDGWTG
ncbi:NADH-ubiquinone oxidoreductase-F iron-sulfur binding region domain-containing protein [Arthrobacter silvisoli]|uniref:NADH-ubiquinone oxidoreductase-F iron-sulfur binding region domain-containing protein n=1 Tax=Arthrobacter silvisoli TaxID=2291022 RepID=UPI001FE36915|nr:NADH-ubiquinone oxidoreductase-F iron-sulfur binding region domain-containing protein [Arthrobacter silvisoli]